MASPDSEFLTRAAEAAFDGRAELEDVRRGYQENRRILLDGLPRVGLDSFLPADGAFPVSSVGPTFWFGGTVKDTNPAKIGGQGFLELQFYPDSFTTRCTSGGGFQVKHEADVYTACSPVWTLKKQHGHIIEPAAFNGMLRDAARSGPFVMHARDIVDVHIWAPSPDASSVARAR